MFKTEARYGIGPRFGERAYQIHKRGLHAGQRVFFKYDVERYGTIIGFSEHRDWMGRLEAQVVVKAETQEFILDPDDVEVVS